jgi:hypothetical protein
MAQTIKGTKQADLSLNGTDGADKLLGKDGNDTITGGKGNDDIDGGKGIDTAVYSGNYDDYTISFLSNRNGHGADDSKISVADDVAGRDGADSLKNVEWLKFSDALVDLGNNVVYFADHPVDASAQDPLHPGTLIAGSGIPANDFGVVRAQDPGIELALGVHHRSGPPANAAVPSTDNYQDGVLHFQVNAGADPANANRAEWNFDYSIATGLNGQTTDLSDFTFKLRVDVDPTSGTNYTEYTMAAGGTSSANVHWTDQYGHAILDDEGIAGIVAQNSENYGFGQFRDTDPVTPGIQAYNFGPAHFDIELQALQGTQLLAANHVVVDVI